MPGEEGMPGPGEEMQKCPRRRCKGLARDQGLPRSQGADRSDDVDLRDLAELVFSNLRRMKGRVIMTALGVVIGTAARYRPRIMGAGLQRRATESLGSGRFADPVTGERDAAVRSSPGSACGRRGIRRDPSQLGIRYAWTPRRRGDTRPAQCQGRLPHREPADGGEMIFGRLRGWGQIVGVEPEMLSELAVKQGSTELLRGQVVMGGRVPENFYDGEMSPCRPKVMAVGGSPGGTSTPDLYNQVVRIDLQRWSEDGSLGGEAGSFSGHGRPGAGGMAPRLHDLCSLSRCRGLQQLGDRATPRDPERDGYHSSLSRQPIATQRSRPNRRLRRWVTWCSPSASRSSS